MIKTILIVSGSVIVALLLLFWLLTGGIGSSARTASGFFNPLTWYFHKGEARNTFRLPFALDVPQGPDVSELLSADQTTRSDEEIRAAIEAKFASFTRTSDPKTFGNPSPRIGQVTLRQQNPSESDPSRESLVLYASAGNTAPILITAWSLQSAVTGARAYIPYGSALFVQGTINTQQPIYLSPGTTAILTTGYSSVGTSFQENMCTGYLDELQSFTPALSSQCPNPAGEMPLTADNIRIYGETCLDFVPRIQTCRLPANIPTNLSPACRSFIANNFSYNGCVRAHQQKTNFALPSWRIYLGSNAELWQNLHDVIRLLDEKGQVVDVLTY